MCEADAFLVKNGREEKILESVDIVELAAEGARLINIFGEQKTIRAVVRRYQNRPGKIVFEPI